MPKAPEKKRAKSAIAEIFLSAGEFSPLKLIEREREFLSSELHDTIAQSLSGLTILISFLHSRLEKGQAITSGQIKELQVEAYKAGDELRIFSFSLKPQNLGGGGLILALSELVDFTTQSRPCEFECKKPVFVSSPDRAFAFFRIAQEALRCATEAQRKKTIKVKLSQAGNEIILEISPFPIQKPGNNYPATLIDLYCGLIGGKTQFKSRTNTLRCKAMNI